MKLQLEVTLNAKTNAFQVKNYLQNCSGVKKVYVVTCQKLIVYYDDKKIQPKIIAKWIGNVGRENGRRRITNIASMREINDNNTNAA
jgi:hypothetical protein